MCLHKFAPRFSGDSQFLSKLQLESLAPKIIALPELGLVNRRNPKALWRFKFYKLAAAVKRIVAVARLYETIAFPQATRQMFLPLTDGARVTPARA